MEEEVKHHSEHIPQWKKDEIDEIKNLIGSYSSVGLVGIHGIPSNQLQMMRKNLRGMANIKVCRNTLLFRAIDASSEDVKQMSKYVEEQTGLLFTNENPFKLFKILKEGKTSAPIKAGTASPKDIIVEKGPTSFPPGPIVGELQSVGIPAAIDRGKVVIRETKTVAKEGDVVNEKLASILTRLEIHPMELGLDLRVVYENGVLYESKILDIDETQYFSNLTLAVRQALNLSINAVYPTKANITALLSKAASESMNLAFNAEIFVPEVIEILLLKGNSQMLSLARVASQKDENAIGDKLKEKLEAQPKEEEKQEVAEESAEEEKEQTEEEKESDVAAGLGSLFG